MAKKNRKGNSSKMPHHTNRNNHENREEREKMIICNFDKETPQEIPFTAVSEKRGIKIELRLKHNEEYFLYPCDPVIASRDDLFKATSSGRKNLRIVYISLQMRPSIPGRGSANSFFLSIIDFKTGKGTTYKVGILNVVPDMSNTLLSYFVKCKVTPHYLWNTGTKSPGIESFIDVPLEQFLHRLSNKKEKFSMLPKKFHKLEIPFPKRSSTPNTARNVFFDPFEGRGVALTNQNALCLYGIDYLETKCADIFPREGAVFKDFFTTPLSQLSHPMITHIAIRAKAYGEIKAQAKTKKAKNSPKYNEVKLNQLFSIRSFYAIGENENAARVLSHFLLQ